MEPIFFDGWAPIVRTVVTCCFAFVGIVAILRLSGKRSLSKFNSFDFIVTIAFGSILAATLLNDSVTVARGLAAFATLTLLQAVVTFCTARSSFVEGLVTARPTLLFWNGDFDEAAMKRMRVTMNELRAATRDSSIGSMEDVAAMVMEGDGTISVVPKAKLGEGEIIPDQAPA